MPVFINLVSKAWCSMCLDAGKFPFYDVSGKVLLNIYEVALHVCTDAFKICENLLPKIYKFSLHYQLDFSTFLKNVHLLTFGKNCLKKSLSILSKSKRFVISIATHFFNL